jgi:hypothetical protein
MKNDGKNHTKPAVKPDKPIQRPPEKKPPQKKDTPSLFAPVAKLIHKLVTLIPAPRITSPTAGGSVTPGATLDVSIDTNCPDLPHELLLFDALNTTSPIAFTQIPDPTTGPFPIDIPADPGTAMEYYLEVGIPPGVAQEQQRHRIAITTEPPVLSISALSGNPPPGTYQLTDSAGVTVQFDVSVYGGSNTPSFNWDFGDNGTSTLQNPSHAFTSTGLLMVSVTVKSRHGEVRQPGADRHNRSVRVHNVNSRLAMTSHPGGPTFDRPGRYDSPR